MVNRGDADDDVLKGENDRGKNKNTSPVCFYQYIKDVM